jgi:hypothetical protein
MNMLSQGLTPGVKHCRDPNFSAQMCGVAGKFLQGLGGGLEQ